MKEKIRYFFSGRNGMDELNKVLLIGGVVLMLLSTLCGSALNSIPSVIFSWLGWMAIVYFVIRVFSRDLTRRQQENCAYLSFLQRKKDEFAAAKERRKQKDYRFFKCPGCGAWLRVPKGKGRIHINCKCGYTLYRKT